MKNIRYIVAVIALLASATAKAQTQYIVSSVSGDVKVMRDGKTVELTNYTKLTEQTILVIGNGGEVVLNCPDKQMQYTCNTPGRAKVAAVVEKTKTVGQLNAKFLKFLQMQASGTPKVQETRTAAVHRDLTLEADSLAADTAKAKAKAAATVKKVADKTK